MPIAKLPKIVQSCISECVAAYEPRRTEYLNLAQRVSQDLKQNANLLKIIHSTKFREKDPSHLKDKLERKAAEAIAGNKPFLITKHNLFKRIHDLAGVRLLHIHTQQIVAIHPLILDILKYHKYTHVGKPIAYTWDIENQSTLESSGLKVKPRKDMYTSVHYTVRPHTGSGVCEIQVRTLAEELWGEVSHTINYPRKTTSIACAEQLLALARIASGCTRLVDSIFASHKVHLNNQTSPEHK